MAFFTYVAYILVGALILSIVYCFVRLIVIYFKRK
jgi:hypothetical protein